MLPDPSLPPGTDRIPQIRHLVLLMENHSFDNYLGTLGRGNGLPNPPPVNRRHDGTAVPAHHFATTGQLEHVPSQSWRASHQQFDQGRNDGFVTSVEDLAPDADATVGMGTAGITIMCRRPRRWNPMACCRADWMAVPGRCGGW